MAWVAFVLDVIIILIGGTDMPVVPSMLGCAAVGVTIRAPQLGRWNCFSRSARRQAGNLTAPADSVAKIQPGVELVARVRASHPRTQIAAKATQGLQLGRQKLMPFYARKWRSVGLPMR